MARGRAKLGEIGLPLGVFVAALAVWQAIVQVAAIPSYILPSPWLISATLVDDWQTLSASLLVTLGTTFLALFSATFISVILALLFARWKWVERSFLPFAVILQVTPIIAISPLLLVYLDTEPAVLVCAFLVAFFPILSNSVLGLASADRNLVDLFRLYRASGWREVLLLRVPSALPYFLGGLRIGSGLSLVGAIVAEIAAGSAGHSSGLAFRIVEAGYLVNIPRMFAALVLISVTGLLIYGFFALLSHLLLRRWHASAVRD